MREIGGLLKGPGRSSEAWSETKFVFYVLPQVWLVKGLESKTSENNFREP